MRIMYDECPCCQGRSISKALSAKDYTVSGEVFEIWLCNTCSARFTQNVPGIKEIQQYYKSENYISHSDTKKGVINSLYHFVRSRTLTSKKNIIKKFTGLSYGKVLDVGAGTGAFLKTMHNAGWIVTGVEPDESARENASSLYNINLKNADSFFGLPVENYDAITLWHVLEHVHDLHKYLHQLKNLLKANGCIFIAVPNYTCYDEKVYEEFWAAYDVPRHLYHFSPASITQLLLHHGLQLTAIKPMWFDSYYVSMLSEKYKTGRSNFLRAVWNGFVSNWKALLDKEKCSSLIYVVRNLHNN